MVITDGIAVTDGITVVIAEVIAETTDEILAAVPQALAPAPQTLLDAIEPEALDLIPPEAVAQAVAPAAGSAQHLLPHARAIEGQVVETLQGRFDLAGPLIKEAIGIEAPAAGARQPRVAAGHQVVDDATAGVFDDGIDQAAEGLAATADQLGLQQRGEQVKGLLVGVGRFTADHRFAEIGRAHV